MIIDLTNILKKILFTYTYIKINNNKQHLSTLFIKYVNFILTTRVKHHITYYKL